jgi:quaternary ammonium compound-resistance protein SugE
MVGIAGLLEIVWAVLLKQSEGFSKLWPSLGFVAAGAGSIVLLALALRDLPVSSAYAAWTGIGAVGTAIAGIVILDESARAGKLVSVAFVVVGVVGLRIFSEH